MNTCILLLLLILHTYMLQSNITVHVTLLMILSTVGVCPTSLKLILFDMYDKQSMYMCIAKYVSLNPHYETSNMAL